jgi:hypothetical protein
MRTTGRIVVAGVPLLLSVILPFDLEEAVPKPLIDATITYSSE